MTKIRTLAVACVLFGLNAQAMPTGVHWAAPSEYAMLRSKGIDFVVTAANEADTARLSTILNTARATGMQVIVGMIQYPQAGTSAPHPYNLVGSTWSISAAGTTFLTTMKTFEATSPGVIMALFVFNEPFWVSPLTGLSDTVNGCPAMTSTQLRSLRATIRGVWPAAKIYHDIGSPSFWAPGGEGYIGYACIRTKYEVPLNVADYVGIWQYPFKNSPATYTKATSLAKLKNDAEVYIPASMQPAESILLGQAADAPLTDNLRFPSFAEMADWNCALRGVRAAGLSWYVWDQNFYRNELSSHPDYLPADYLPAAVATSCMTLVAPIGLVATVSPITQ